MLKSPVYNSSPHFVYRKRKPFLANDNVEALLKLHIRLSLKLPNTPRLRFASHSPSTVVKASVAEKPVSAHVVVTVKRHVGRLLPNLWLKRRLYDVTHLWLWGTKTLVLELLSAHMDPTTGLEKGTIKVYAQKVGRENEDGEITYETELVNIPAEFGAIGAVLVENEHNKELFLKDIVIHGVPYGPLRFSCNSWLNPKSQSDDRRIFFTTKSYLPSNTPEGLKRFRVEELKNLQGNGHGKRESHHRIYDYDVYNDLGDPDRGEEFKRPVLGGKQHPYPRRCRTGRARSEADPLSEVTSSNFYVPRDEAFLDTKQVTTPVVKTVYSMLHGFIPALEPIAQHIESRFLRISTTYNLLTNRAVLPSSKHTWEPNALLPRLIDFSVDKIVRVLLLGPSQAALNRDKFFWFKDEEFARQTLAGLNPCSIRLVTEWPLESKLDPDIYGPTKSAITNEIIEQQIKGFMTLNEAVEQKKLYILDYHDLLLPYVAKVRKIEGKTLYGSRTLFFLNPDNTLKPLAIELTRPPMDGKPQWKDVFTPCLNSTGLWLWRIAKAHVLAHDSGYHQLVSHWLRTHCSVEPYIIAMHRQMSAMHPIYRLLHPHFRYTMEINAVAREALTNVGGIIETAFSLGKYSMEVSSMAYQKQWQFNLEALPLDLIHRGLAVEDPNAAHGLKLSIEDYPFANDGLILWDAIKQWATEYVNHYYSEASLVKSDEELQAWWTEIRTVGHGDKKDEPWWPILNTPKDLIEVVTTIMWVTSGHHAAVNFGQYYFASYFPVRLSVARINIPTEEPNSKLWNRFLEDPERVFLDTFPAQIQATVLLSILNILSTHSPEEEYLGEDMEAAWADDPVVKQAFQKFSGRLKKLEEIIDQRNANPKLKNRHGAGVDPYQLLKPYSEPGVTVRGVPCSVSI